MPRTARRRERSRHARPHDQGPGCVASYLPFGGIDQVSVDTGALGQDLRFPGQWFQAGEPDRKSLRRSDFPANGLHQNGMRDYDPTTGRYLEADPLGLVDGPSVYGYARQSPVRWTDRTGLFCASGGGTTICAAPGGGPVVQFPTPEGWQDFGPNSNNYHSYNKAVDLPGSLKCLLQALIKLPSPGYPLPASPEGALNDATPEGFNEAYDFFANFANGGITGTGEFHQYNASPIKSYVTTDLSTGNTVVVNVTMPGHPLFPGYVARIAGQGHVDNYGERTSPLQAPGALFADAINNVWLGQTRKAAKQCGCE